ncbi:MAG TPA: ATP-binding cassette domain-containing protein [Propionibacteriaceae bacterium]|nr:ATP-binding cassette domain-containing protein [Propionibacteriaceae bacterium]
MSGQPAAVVFDDVAVTYPGRERPTLSGVSLAVPEGDLAVVIGRTGSGKSTLLGAINGLVPHFSGGELRGTVTAAGHDTRTTRPRDLAAVVGFVPQDPLSSFVTDRVDDEVAYGMEQVGVASRAIRKRVEETLDLLGIAALRHRPLVSLSGGEQQRVAIAAVLAGQPRILVLDEPTSALDPTAAHDVLSAIAALVHDVGLTVVLAEHRLERVSQFADTMLWLPGDGTVVPGPPEEVLGRADVHPPLVRLARRLGWSDVPVSVRAARRRVRAEDISVRPAAGGPSPAPAVAAPVVSARRLGVRYGQVDALRGVDLDLPGSSVTVIMGRNGSGKSSLLWAIAGAVGSSGDLVVDGTDPRRLDADHARRVVALVPQTASDLLYLPSVGAECDQADAESAQPGGTCRGILDDLGLGLDPGTDPRDLSEGQRLALVLAIQLTGRPRVLLLDEPTRGLDYAAKERLARIVGGLRSAGHCLVVSTHDVEFAALVGDRTVLLADGEVIADGPTREVVTSSPAYAPQVAKVFFPTPVLTPDEIALVRPPSGSS